VYVEASTLKAYCANPFYNCVVIPLCQHIYYKKKSVECNILSD
jgi:hypothetical protein